MATWRTGTQGFNGSVNSGTVTEPSGSAQNDFQTLVLVGSNGISFTTPMTDWTLLSNQVGLNARIAIFTRTRGATAGNLTYTGTFSAGSIEHTMVSVALGGAPTIDASAVTTIGEATSPDPPSATATGGSDEAIAVGVNWFGASTNGATVPSGYTKRVPNNTGQDCAIASKTLSATGAENPGTFTNYGGSSTTVAATILIRLSSSGTTISPNSGSVSMAGVAPSMNFTINMPPES